MSREQNKERDKEEAAWNVFDFLGQPTRITMKPNPFYSAYAWWWDDEYGRAHGPYDTQTKATYALFKRIDPRRSLWQRLKDALKGR